MPGPIIIDDTGERWPMGAPKLRELMMCPDPDIDVVAYAVRNLGYVLLRPQGRFVRAELRAELLKPATLIGVYYTLLDLKPQQILLSRLHGAGSSHELFDDVAEFAATLERDIEDEGVQRHRPHYSLSQRSLRQLHRSRYQRFTPVVALWAAESGYLPRDLLVRLRGFGLQGRAALVRNSAGSSRLVYEYVGSSYSFVGNACLPLLLVGKDIEELPDPEYGDWAARSYHQCIKDQEPRLETVSAVMKRTDGQRLWSYYDRVLLPWRTSAGTRFVLGLSEVRRRMLAA
jgi:hypothetical protein